MNPEPLVGDSVVFPSLGGRIGQIVSRNKFGTVYTVEVTYGGLLREIAVRYSELHFNPDKEIFVWKPR